MYLTFTDSTQNQTTKHQSTVVITGVPTKNYRLPSEWIKPNTTVVNVASFKNVNEDEILQIEGVQYIPMVGKVTGSCQCCLFAL
jgi:methylenetetrahydrofolate dehydrogenase (NAD+)